MKFLLTFWLALAAIGPASAEPAHHQGGAATIRSGQALAQPWSDRKGSFRGRAFLSYMYSGSAFDGGGAKASLPGDGRFQGTALNLYGEYAVTDRWSASGLVPLQYSQLHSAIGRDHWTSLGDTFGWARYRANARGDWTPSIAAGLKLPGTYRTVSGLGDGQTDVDLQGFVSRRVSPSGYLAFNTGYRYRAGSISNEVVFGAQTGWTKERWSIVPAMSGAFGVGSGIPKDFLNLGLSVFRSIAADWSVLASYNRVVSGKNTTSADVWTIGMAFR